MFLSPPISIFGLCEASSLSVSGQIVWYSATVIIKWTSEKKGASVSTERVFFYIPNTSTNSEVWKGARAFGDTLHTFKHELICRLIVHPDFIICIFLKSIISLFIECWKFIIVDLTMQVRKEQNYLNITFSVGTFLGVRNTYESMHFWDDVLLSKIFTNFITNLKV